MMEMYTAGHVEVAGKKFDMEVDFEWWDGEPVIFAVRAVKIVAKEVWYDSKGVAHKGREFAHADITAFVDLDAIKKEITELDAWMRGEIVAERRAA